MLVALRIGFAACEGRRCVALNTTKRWEVRCWGKEKVLTHGRRSSPKRETGFEPCPKKVRAPVSYRVRLTSKVWKGRVEKEEEEGQKIQRIRASPSAELQNALQLFVRRASGSAAAGLLGLIGRFIKHCADFAEKARTLEDCVRRQ